MIAYVESNFVLEIALGQESSQPADEIVNLAEDGELKLVFPSFALSEPFTTLEHRTRERSRLYSSLTEHLKQLSRSVPHQADVLTLEPMLPTLLQIGRREDDRLAEITERLLTVGRSIPMDRQSFLLSRELRRRLRLSAPDAIILAAVLTDLAGQESNEQKWFFSRNWKDFADPRIVDRLHSHNCRYAENIANGLAEIRAALAQR